MVSRYQSVLLFVTFGYVTNLPIGQTGGRSVGPKGSGLWFSGGFLTNGGQFQATKYPEINLLLE